MMNNQRGAVLLAELIIVTLITCMLATAMVGNMMTFRISQNQSMAESQVRMVGRAQALIALCSMQTGCVANVGVTSQVPAAGSVTMSGYTFTFVSGANWTYVAKPTASSYSGLYSFYVDQSNTVRCLVGNPVATSPVCGF
jgi:type II secretory pathway pseudopilin PulG